MSIDKIFENLILTLNEGAILPGGIRTGFATCGQANCKCKEQNNPQLHGPYNTLSFSLKEKSSSMSITKEDVLTAENMTERFQKAKSLFNQLAIAYLEKARSTKNLSALEVPKIEKREPLSTRPVSKKS